MDRLPANRTVQDLAGEGGGLYAEVPGGLSLNDYSWVPNSVLSDTTGSNDVSIELPDHPIAAGVLYPALGLLLSPMYASAAMSLSSVSVIANAMRLRRVRL